MTKSQMTQLLQELFGKRNVRPFYNGWLIWVPRDGKIMCTFCSNEEIGHMMVQPTL